MTQASFSNAGWQQAALQFTASGALTTITLNAIRQPSTAYAGLDDVVLLPTPVPEPATLALWSGGLAALAAMRFRRLS